MTSTTAFTEGQFAQTPEFERNLDRLAEVAVHAGLGLAPGQELVMTATLDAIPLARRITRACLQSGRLAGHDFVYRREVSAPSLSLRPGRQLRRRPLLAL